MLKLNVVGWVVALVGLPNGVYLNFGFALALTSLGRVGPKLSRKSDDDRERGMVPTDGKAGVGAWGRVQ